MRLTHFCFEVLGDGDLVVESLPSSSLEDKVTRKVLSRCRLERSQYDRLVQRVTWLWIHRQSSYRRKREMGRTRTDGPMVKGLEAERLSLCVRSEIRLESVGVDDRDVSLDGV
jgi:hypothetical protein